MRVMIYSHDTFGLGHLRRCRRIAHHLVGARKDVSVLIVSGSPLVGSFDYRSRVDFVRVPGVIKRRNGNYEPLNLHIDIQDTLDLRGSIIHNTALSFDPDVLLVDKEPLGLGGEVRATLEVLKARRTRVVLGLRDVMDAPRDLEAEWARKGVIPALEHLYDEIWVYGPAGFHDPLRTLPLPPAVPAKTRFTGFLRAGLPPMSEGPRLPEQPYLAITPGGGGDGEELVDWVLRAYEQDPGLPFMPVFLFGPFMNPAARHGFSARIEALGRGASAEFDAVPEMLWARAAGIIAMGGYNTFSEILSFDKPALLCPRITPRREQELRARRAADLGLCRMIDPRTMPEPTAMAKAIHDLARTPPPSTALPPGWLDGLERLTAAFGEITADADPARSVTALGRTEAS